MTNNDLQNTTQKTKNLANRSQLKSCSDSKFSGRNGIDYIKAIS